ncbi:MAG: hypothetical protein AAF267_16870 [Deinococcota bacterium]
MNIITEGELTAALLSDVADQVTKQNVPVAQYVDAANAFAGQYLEQVGCSYDSTVTGQEPPEQIKRYVIEIAHHRVAVATNLDKDYNTATGESHLEKYAKYAMEYFKGLATGKSVPPCARINEILVPIGVEECPD